MKVEYTNQSPELFAGFYESVFNNSDFINEIAEYKADGTDTQYDIVNWSDYQNSICENCVAWLFNNLPNHDIIKSMKYKELNSPRYYNFSTDTITADVEIDDAGLADYCFKRHRDEFAKYLLDNWTSRDGFISFVNNDILKFEQSPDTTIMIEFYLLNEIDLTEYEYYCYDLANNTIFEFLDPVKEQA